MALITWTESLSVGVEVFDQHHQKLVGLINGLHAAMLERKGKDVMDDLLNSLVLYTKKHFDAEETLLKRHNYPGYLSHIKEHKDLTNRVVSLQNRHKEGSVSISMEVMEFLRDWLTKHILGTDKQYGPFLNERGIK